MKRSTIFIVYSLSHGTTVIESGSVTAIEEQKYGGPEFLSASSNGIRLGVHAQLLVVVRSDSLPFAERDEWRDASVYRCETFGKKQGSSL